MCIIIEGIAGKMAVLYRKRVRERRMNVLPGLIVAAIALFAASTGIHAQTRERERPSDAYGQLDTIRVEIGATTGAGWEATVHLTNDENLAAMTLPFRWGPRHGFYRLDSASYVRTRTEHFAVKTFFPDTLKETILIGLISDIGRGLPPLEPGSGPIARLYFTNMKHGAKPLVLDTTFIRPHNVLQMVTPDVASVRPAFEVKLMDAPPKR